MLTYGPVAVYVCIFFLSVSMTDITCILKYADIK